MDNEHENTIRLNLFSDNNAQTFPKALNGGSRDGARAAISAEAGRL